jgi:hypothetical protein
MARSQPRDHWRVHVRNLLGEFTHVLNATPRRKLIEIGSRVWKYISAAPPLPRIIKAGASHIGQVEGGNFAAAQGSVQARAGQHAPKGRYRLKLNPSSSGLRVELSFQRIYSVTAKGTAP